jgi:hypothetical protein
MTRDETYSLIRSTCTALNVKLTASDLAATVEVWQELFAQFPPDVMRAAKIRVLADHGYNTLPAPAKFVAAIKAMQSAGEPDTLTAWHEVLRAIAKYGQYQEAAAFASLSPRAAYVAERMGWRELCVTPDDATSVIRGQFCKLYAASIEAVPDCRALPGMREGLTAIEARDVWAAIAAERTE